MSARRLTAIAMRLGVTPDDSRDRDGLIRDGVAELDCWSNAHQPALRRGLLTILEQARLNDLVRL
jgi:hypothetical protein